MPRSAQVSSGGVGPRLQLNSDPNELRSGPRPMRFTVCANQNSQTSEQRFETAKEAIREAWRLMRSGAPGVYIYDDVTDRVFWPAHFGELLTT